MTEVLRSGLMPVGRVHGNFGLVIGDRLGAGVFEAAPLDLGYATVVLSGHWGVMTEIAPVYASGYVAVEAGFRQAAGVDRFVPGAEIGRRGVYMSAAGADQLLQRVFGQ